MSIQFKHKDSDTIYTLDGSVLTWGREGKVHKAGGYTDREIERYFKEGTWVKLGETKDEKVETITAKATPITSLKTGGAIASDGGSSSYYDIALPQWLVDKILVRHADGQAYIKTEELIEAGFNSDFDASNIFKSLVRAWGAFNGGGKKGNTVAYDLNKITYSTEKLRQRSARKQQEAA